MELERGRWGGALSLEQITFKPQRKGGGMAGGVVQTAYSGTVGQVSWVGRCAPPPVNSTGHLVMRDVAWIINYCWKASCHLCGLRLDKQDLSAFSWQVCDQFGIKSRLPGEACGSTQIRRSLASTLASAVMFYLRAEHSSCFKDVFFFSFAVCQHSVKKHMP